MLSEQLATLSPFQSCWLVMMTHIDDSSMIKDHRVCAACKRAFWMRCSVHINYLFGFTAFKKQDLE